MSQNPAITKYSHKTYWYLKGCSNYLWILLLIFPLLFNCKKNSDLHRLNTPKPRVISFAPSITETVFALNAQEHLVGVTDFCTYPPEAKQIPKVGGYIDPNFEQIIRLKPDVAILLKSEHGKVLSFLNNQNIKAVTINNENLDGILTSIRKIGAACGVKERGDSLASALEKSLNKEVNLLKKRPKVLFCVGRGNPGSGTIGKVYCAGPRSFYSELIQRAGGSNAVTDSTLAYPSIAGEGIIHLAPDIIIDVMAANRSLDPEKITTDWNKLSMVPAVQLGAVYALTEKYVSIPGPRIINIYNDLHRCISDWNGRCSRGSACLRFK